MKVELSILPGRFAVCRLAAGAAVPPWAASAAGLTSITRTEDELSIVCLEASVPAEVRAERGWACLKVTGPLDFALVGVLASLTAPLAAAGLSVFALSTFDTDYLLVRADAVEEAGRALAAAGHRTR